VKPDGLVPESLASASGNGPLGTGAECPEPHGDKGKWAGLVEEGSWEGMGCEEACVSGARERCFRILEAPGEVSGREDAGSIIF
jgi:hypothetical protein